MRKCFACQTEKPVENFHVRTRMCKECRRAYDASRKGRHGAIRNTIAAKARRKRWLDANLDRVKHEARMAVRRAVANGTMTRATECEQCGSSPRRVDGVTAIQGHHDDYSMPLQVRWLCAKCHTEWHKQNDAALNGGATPGQGGA